MMIKYFMNVLGAILLNVFYGMMVAVVHQCLWYFTSSFQSIAQLEPLFLLMFLAGYPVAIYFYIERREKKQVERLIATVVAPISFASVLFFHH